MSTQQFQLTISHDNGKVKIRTAAKDFEGAKHIVMSAENCPESSISAFFKENKIYGYRYEHEGRKGTVYARKMADLKNPSINHFLIR